jgi:hypothetical protein
MALFQLEVRDAATQQAADVAVLLEHGHIVAGARQLLGGGQAGGAGTDDRDLLAGLDAGGLRLDPAVFPALVDDVVLDGLDADRLGVDAERTGRFTRGRADAAGEIGEVVGRVQHFQRLLRSCRDTPGHSSPE